MSAPKLRQLVEKWKAMADQGTPVSSEELCRDCPELIPHLRQLLDEQIASNVSSSAEAQQESPLPENILIEDSAARTAREEADTLRGRLRLAVFVFLVHWLVFAALVVFLGYPLEAPFSIAFEVIVLLIMAVALGQRWGPWSLSRLRASEALVFGAIVQRIFLGQAVFCRDDFLDLLHTGEGYILHVGADSLAAPWFEVVIVYGLIIPQTWRRCAVVVSCLALAPLALLGGFAYAHGVLQHPMVVAMLVKVGLRLAFAAAVAILGAYRMNALQRQFRDARAFGQYSLKHRLGQGGMAEVYLAEHRALRRLCAIKLIRAENAANANAQRRFAREVRALSRIRHPNIVEIFDYGVSDEGKFYYVMEHLVGLNLEELVQRFGPVPSGRAVHLLRQIALALQALQAHAAIHRDIKPSNIFVSAPDLVKLFDFGLIHLDHPEELASADVGVLTRDNRIVGTPAYMSPEQIDMSRPLDVRSDLYAVGLVGYFLLSGSNPFLRDDVRQVFAAQVREEPPPLRGRSPTVPDDLNGIVHRLLAKNPDQRFADPGSLLAALDQCSAAHDWTQVEAIAWWRVVGIT